MRTIRYNSSVCDKSKNKIFSSLEIKKKYRKYCYTHDNNKNICAHVNIYVIGASASQRVKRMMRSALAIQLNPVKEKGNSQVRECECI